MITCLGLSPALDVTYLLPHLEVGEIHRPREVLRLAGGKAFNLARAATKLGASARVIAPLGGRIGSLIHALALDAGIGVAPVQSAHESRSCVTVASSDDGKLTEFYESAAPLSSAELAALKQEVERYSRRGEWLSLSGSVPAEVDLDWLVVVLQNATAAGVHVAVDTHGAALAAVVADVSPALLKINRSEAVGLLGCADDVELAFLAGSIRDRTGGVVVVTDGVDGSIALNEEGSFRVLPDPSIGRYPVGSGDSFLGGMLSELSQGADLERSLRTAAAAATANAAVPGAALFDLDHFQQVRDRLTVVGVRSE